MSIASTSTSETKTRLCLADWSKRNLRDALVDLVNVQNEDDAGVFLRRWPDLLGLRLNEKFAQRRAAHEGNLSSNIEGLRQQAKAALMRMRQLNIPSGKENRWFVQILARDLQQIWRGDADANSLLTMFLLLEDSYAAHWQAIGSGRRLDEQPVDYMIESDGRDYPRDIAKFLWADRHRGVFDYKPQTPFQAALHLLLKEYKRVKVCKNPACLTKFFWPDKAQTRFHDECAKESVRMKHLDWWNNEGRDQRKAKSEAAKRAKKSKRGRR